MNSPKDITVKGNTVYDGNGWYVGRQYNNSIYNFSFNSNIIFTTLSDQLAAQHTNSGLDATTNPVVSTVQESLQQLGAVDNNFYNLPNSTPFNWYYAPTIGGDFTFPPSVNFSTWQTYSGLDANSVEIKPAGNSRFEYNATSDNKTNARRHALDWRGVNRQSGYAARRGKVPGLPRVYKMPEGT